MAMRAQVLNQEVIANNLANADTAAFNEDKAVFSSFHDVLMYMCQPSQFSVPIGSYTGGTVIRDVQTIRGLGPMETTGNSLDVALPAGEYLCVDTPAGVRYTRRGDFQVSVDGHLSVAGHRLLGTAGVLQVQSGRSCRISEDGTVLDGDTAIGTLRVVQVQNEDELRKEGNSLFIADDSNIQVVTAPNLMCGALEKSSVDPVKEMVNLISAMRSYEAAQRAIKSHDEATDQAVNRVGRV
jgi:flagellar basal-body rod protein FlgG